MHPKGSTTGLSEGSSRALQGFIEFEHPKKYEKMVEDINPASP